MKKAKWLIWPFITLAAFVIARMVFQHFNIFGGNGFQSQGMQAAQGGGFSQGGHFGGGEGFGRMGGHRHMHGFGGMGILLDAGLVVGGWIIWKLAAGNKIRKWMGLALMAVGAAFILKVLVLPVILVAAYFVYKIRRNGNASSASYVQAEAAGFSGLDSQKLDYLDKWENNISKEDK